MSRRSPSLIPVNSYGDEPDYIDKEGNEVRYNKTKPVKKTNKGRFTVVEPFTSTHDIREIKKTISKLKPVKKTIVKNPEKIYELNGRQLGRFKVTIKPGSPSRPRSGSPSRSRSPSRPRSRSTSRRRPTSASRRRQRSSSRRRQRSPHKLIDFVKNPEKFYDLDDKQIGRFNVKIKQKPKYSFPPIIYDPDRVVNPKYSNRFEIVDYDENLI
jgi:hypothetical protein